MAEETHPAWSRLTPTARLLHARNTGQVLGAQCDRPSAFLVCWTPDGCISAQTRTRATGGTATAIVIAAQHGVPVFNLRLRSDQARLASFLAACTEVNR